VKENNILSHLPKKEMKAQEWDATGDAISTGAGYKKL